MSTRINLDWTVGWSREKTAKLERSVPSRVPGAVQLDWARAEGWPPHFQADEYRRYDWMSDVFWTYRASLPEGNMPAEEQMFLVCLGADYQCEVRVGGDLRHAQEGMHIPFEIDVTTDAGREIEILIFPAPEGEGQAIPERVPRIDCKPPVAYGWDFHPPLIPLGLWDETFVEKRPSSHLRRVELFPLLHRDLTGADVRLEVDLTGPPAGTLLWTLRDRDGNIALERQQAVTGPRQILSATLDRVDLWWPNGQGDPVLYRSRVEWRDGQNTLFDARESHIGFRRIRLVKVDGWDGGPWPLTQSNPPATFEVNGRTIFAKGTNWAPIDIFPGTVTKDAYRVQLTAARDANMNLIRCWGGGFVNKESFFDLCDEMGLMVWQEFTRACHRYADDPRYLDVLDRESRAIIGRLRSHPSLVLWCGGNELFNSWSQNTEQDLHLRLTARNCFDLDPQTPYIHTSPFMGIGHGPYWFDIAGGGSVFQIFADSKRTGYCEFGVPGAPSAETLRRIIPAAELFPPKRGTAWETHFGLGAWGGDKDSWLMPQIIGKYLGAPSDIDDLAWKSQLLQAVGYKVIFEEARRQKPYCAMALNWCFNEPWPCAANNSLIAWPAEPKPALAAVSESLRPVLASARAPRFDWSEGEVFEAELWMLNDSPDPVAAGQVEASLHIAGSEIPLARWSFETLVENTNLRGPTARCMLPTIPEDLFRLRLSVSGRPALDSEYIFAKRRVG